MRIMCTSQSHVVSSVFIHKLNTLSILNIVYCQKTVRQTLLTLLYFNLLNNQWDTSVRAKKKSSLTRVTGEENKKKKNKMVKKHMHNTKILFTLLFYFYDDEIACLTKYVHILSHMAQNIAPPSTFLKRTSSFDVYHFFAFS